MESRIQTVAKDTNDLVKMDHLLIVDLDRSVMIEAYLFY
jgi:hypothetical protein